MLDQDTKRRIDAARQVLVGKVPDPKQQVDQITTALVYKFMDDMDKQSQELGGQSKFFTGSYNKFGWSKVLDKRISGQERLDLYAESIAGMSKNPHIPQLFREIFKDAFLPYRDPETLSLFLKEIDGFSYDHSENLGDAFEYLLSVLGSQGDAGQFRTPRHIIDFIIEAVDPQKDQTILDPACGTAGFLISSYKHILNNHDGLNNKTGKPTKREKHLTPDELKRLMSNFTGYDISPDMVKLSRVNLYLHGFQDPKIFEYDTLTSEKNWDAQFDVIVANPPFMTPKGGIRPHKRFSVQANRSEVLFVDYILEHLSPRGRAGIIVPEGVIFKAENAYKNLRRMLVEDGLFAVVSLPQGVFNPYSGVKTSILLFDNQIAKQSDQILFLKIENDGFDLGAQRRKIDKNDLPQALDALVKRRHGKRNESPLAHWVKKKKIAESGDYNLSAAKYQEHISRKNNKWPEVKLGELIDITTGKLNANQAEEFGKFPFYTCGRKILRINKPAFEGESVLLAGNGDFGLTYHAAGSFNAYQRVYVIKSNNASKLSNKYLFQVLKKPFANILSQGGVIQYLRVGQITGIRIPLPPIEVQKEIVEQIEVKQNAIDHAKATIKDLERERRYFGQGLRKLDDIEWIEMEKVADTFTDGNWIESKDQSASGIRLIQTGNIGTGAYLAKDDKARFISTDTFKRLKCTEVFEGDVLISRLPDPVGRACLIPKLDTRAITAVDCTIVRFDLNKVRPKFFVLYSMTDDYFESLGQFLTGSSRSRISRSNLAKVKMPLPTVDVQKQLVAEAEKEEETITANQNLIALMAAKINKILAEI